MKRLLACLICLTVIAVMAAGLSLSAFAFDEYYDYVTFTATGDDPYAVFKFSSTGNNKKIDPDSVTWAAIRYRTVSKTDSDGEYYTGQLYIMPFLEPCIPIEYKFSGNWETAVIDLLEVNDFTALDSKWNSEFYTTRSEIRFDPLESSRDPEMYSDEYDAEVIEGASIDIAWICFFENEADAKAYTGREDTPYCVLGPGALSKLREPVHNLKVERHQIDTPEPGHETPTPSPTPEPTPTPVPTDTPVPTEKPTEAPTGAPETVSTEAPENVATEAPAGNTGCGGAAAGGWALISLAAAAFILRRKK